MTEAERIEYLITTLESGSGQKFANRVGLSAASLSRIRKGDYGIRLKINAILKAYPQVRREWLDTGEGYPGELTIDLVKDHYEKKIKRQEEIIDQLIKKINDIEDQMSQKKIVKKIASKK